MGKIEKGADKYKSKEQVTPGTGAAEGGEGSEAGKGGEAGKGDCNICSLGEVAKVTRGMICWKMDFYMCNTCGATTRGAVVDKPPEKHYPPELMASIYLGAGATKMCNTIALPEEKQPKKKKKKGKDGKEEGGEEGGGEGGEEAGEGE